MSTNIELFKGRSIASFGGKDLANNLDVAEKAITVMENDFRIHNHSNTQFAWTRFVLIHKGGIRNIRQISAEITQKASALATAKEMHAKAIVKVKRLKRDLSQCSDALDAELLRCKIDAKEDGLRRSLPLIEGAIKDIITLKSKYDELMVQYNGYTEADLEREEIDYWIRRLFTQALRDMRQYGTITVGNQEAIENLGLSASYIMRELGLYLEKERECKDHTSKLLTDFLEQCVEKFHDTVAEFNGYGGFTGAVLEESTYKAIENG